ncbi:MAG TPA: alpha/beta hydrolase [Paraburkholderia sp.]|jgi:pimeloyl-ACP methyl ester carboxylesterase|nr:alpha/beta hydrolase [Paraburkholderia sp.]
MSAWILLRGLTREARHWGALPALLHDALDGARIVPIDLPGNGEFASLRSYANVPDMVGFVRLALLQSGVPGPYRVLAMSLGGMVAIDWAQRHPHEIAQLVLINTSMRPFSRMHERLRPRAWPTLLRIARAWGDAPAAEAEIHALTCNARQAQAADVAAWAQIRRSAPVSRANALRQLAAAAAFRAAPTAPQSAVLVLSSDGDGLVNPLCSVSLARAWNALHRRHAWAGHDLPHDDPAWTVRQVRAWSLSLDTQALDRAPE